LEVGKFLKGRRTIAVGLLNGFVNAICAMRLKLLEVIIFCREILQNARFATIKALIDDMVNMLLRPIIFGIL